MREKGRDIDQLAQMTHRVDCKYSHVLLFQSGVIVWDVSHLCCSSELVSFKREKERDRWVFSNLCVTQAYF